MTALSPLEEVLFQSWARAHGVDNQDDPKNQFDHRGLYKQTNGMIMPGQVVRQMAQSHNLAMEPQEAGGDTVNPDPFMAQAEMHGNELKAKTDMAKEQHKAQLESQKHQQKVELEQMKLQHKSMEADKDRAHKAQEQEQARQQAAQDAERQRQMDAQAMQQQRQYQVEDNQANQQHEMHSTLMQEQLARTRPQPGPSQAGQGVLPTAQGQGGPPPGQPPASPTGMSQPAQPSNTPLQQQLMQRAQMHPQPGQAQGPM